MEVGKTITQNDINQKLFESLEKLDERMDKFEAKMADRMDKFETKINAQLNWQLAIFTVIMVGVLAKVITS
ncbi:MAG: hypothetical protein HQL46_05015 [Gammaproteobacteria bacterium]|nr:hypothetical protein [Gammaproteobacteria bacterium]